MKKWCDGILELLFPPRCRVCDGQTPMSPSEGLCDRCLKRVAYINTPLCVRCGRSFAVHSDQDHTCERCLRRRPPYQMARAVAYYAEPVSTLLHLLKYRNDATTVPPLLKIAQGFDFSAFHACDIVIAVPLHPGRLKKRGANHAHTLAHLFFKEKKKIIRSDILLRTRDTVAQTGLNGVARRKNLRSAFCVENKNVIHKKTICLVDDVFTTGTTVSECAKTLMMAGAGEVKVLTMARVKERNE